MSKTNQVLIALFVAWGLIAVSTSKPTDRTVVPSASTGCQPSDITVKSVKAGFVDSCRRTPCPALKGVAVITNRCPTPARIEMQFTAFDNAGNPVATNKLWPASVNTIPPGDYTFSLDSWLEFDPLAKSFDLSVASVREP